MIYCGIGKIVSSIKEAAQRLREGKDISGIANEYAPERETFQQRMLGIEAMHAKAIDEGRMRGI